jgi:site-specific recombinase XerD
MIEEGVTDNFPFTSQTFKNLRNIPKRMAVRMTVPEGLKFLEQARHKKRDFAIMMTFLNTGIRESELFNLKKSDYGNNKLRLIGKGDKERIVSVNHMTQTAINNYLAQRTDHKEWLFISNKKGKYSPSGLYTLVKTIAKKAGIEKNITPHTLRHTFASMMKSQGRDAYEIMQILGHNDIRTTMIYLGTLEDDRVEAILEESAFNV